MKIDAEQRIIKPRAAEQVETFHCSSADILLHPHFAKGFDDVRAGLTFADQVEDAFWAYERGRQFGLIAPRSMALFVDGRLNPKAVRLYDAAADRGLIL